MAYHLFLRFFLFPQDFALIFYRFFLLSRNHFLTFLDFSLILKHVNISFFSNYWGPILQENIWKYPMFTTIKFFSVHQPKTRVKLEGTRNTSMCFKNLAPKQMPLILLSDHRVLLLSEGDRSRQTSRTEPVVNHVL